MANKQKKVLKVTQISTKNSVCYTQTSSVLSTGENGRYLKKVCQLGEVADMVKVA